LKGSVFVFVLLGFVATSWMVTITRRGCIPPFKTSPRGRASWAETAFRALASARGKKAATVWLEV
jgi:hypothetical protein